MKKIALIVMVTIALLTSACGGYTEADLDTAREEGYQEGYDAATEELQSEIDSAYDSGYEAALEDYNVNPGVTWATVYYTDGGECYHTNPSCVSLRGHSNIHETTLDVLAHNGSDLRPCDICVPHSDE